jgi:nucleoside-diphosphate-sugar epimerase
MPKVLVVGASGLVGMAAIKHFASLPRWEVVGVSRRRPSLDGFQFVPVDLFDAQDCQDVFGAMTGVTHVVYAALHEAPGLMPGWLDDETCS